MKITFIMAGGFTLAGGDRVIATYAEKLVERGHTVLAVAAIPSSGSLKRRALNWSRRLNVGPFKFPPHHFQNTAVPHRRLKRPGPVVASDIPDADVVIATWWETAEWVDKLPASKGRKFHFVQHYEAFEYCPRDRVDAVLRLPFQKITISQWLVDLLVGFNNRDIKLILNSVDTTKFVAPRRERNRRPRVGMLYSSIPWKGCDVALRAFADARLQIPGLELVTFGAHDSKIHPSYPLPEGATFTFRPDQAAIPEIYASCDAWLCGSYGEGFHLPPLEAMACRTPVVSTAVGGPSDIIDNGVNGYIVPIGDSKALGESLVSLLRLPDEEWMRMSTAAYETAHAYTWDDATNFFEGALLGALDSNQA